MSIFELDYMRRPAAACPNCGATDPVAREVSEEELPEDEFFKGTIRKGICFHVSWKDALLRKRNHDRLQQAIRSGAIVFAIECEGKTAEVMLIASEGVKPLDTPGNGEDNLAIFEDKRGRFNSFKEAQNLRIKILLRNHFVIHKREDLMTAL